MTAAINRIQGAIARRAELLSRLRALQTSAGAIEGMAGRVSVTLPGGTTALVRAADIRSACDAEAADLGSRLAAIEALLDNVDALLKDAQ